jgi:putative transcriptional regulator
LLLSEPYLSDPYFRRTVILLCDHNEEGSFGFVLNRFIDVGVEDLLEDMPGLDTRVSIGGPVQSGELFYLHTLGAHVEGSRPVIEDIHMGGDFGQLRSMLQNDPRLARHVRFFVGYSGWGREQLAREMTEGSWLVAEADRAHVMNVKEDDLWGHVLRDMGTDFAPLANFPEDPTLN